MQHRWSNNNAAPENPQPPLAHWPAVVAYATRWRAECSCGWTSGMFRAAWLDAETDGAAHVFSARQGTA